MSKKFPFNPLDEIHDDPKPPTLAEFGTEIHSNNVLYFFYNSAFFDPQCANNALLNIIITNTTWPPAEREKLLWDRHAFEEKLRRDFVTGVHFVVVGEPGAPGEPWVIQRQRKEWLHNDGGGGGRRLETVVEATYWSVGNAFRMAPSLRDIVASKMLSVANQMSQFIDTAQSLASFSPASGHTYLPPNLQSAAPSKKPQSLSRAGSVIGGEDAASVKDGSVRGDDTAHNEDHQTTFNDTFFLRSLQMNHYYNHEYMDENPLQGEPGSFVFASTNEQVEARNKAAAERAAAAAAQAASASFVSNASTVPIPGTPGVGDGKSAGTSVAPTPKGLPAEGGSRKGSVVGVPPKGKGKGKKTKGPGGSPMTPRPGTPGLPPPGGSAP